MIGDDPKLSEDFFHEVADLADKAVNTVAGAVKSVGDAVTAPKGEVDAGAIGDTPKGDK